jgi:hypothetical protein
VEFNHAINYVNKIKVDILVHFFIQRNHISLTKKTEPVRK